MHTQCQVSIRAGYEIFKVQEKVKAAIENMTGLEVEKVDIQIANVSISKEK